MPRDAVASSVLQRPEKLAPHSFDAERTSRRSRRFADGSAMRRRMTGDFGTNERVTRQCTHSPPAGEDMSEGSTAAQECKERGLATGPVFISRGLATGPTFISSLPRHM